jgi:hypothetical protein
MDLEKELRQAMADHVAEASAPASLVTDVRRRHRRRVVRIRTTLGVAATAVVAVAITPTYHAITIGAAPVGAPETTNGMSRTPAPPAAPQPIPPGTPDPRTLSGTAGPGATGRPSAVPPSHRGELPAHLPVSVRKWVTYLPPGLRPSGPCQDERTSSRQTTTCRWKGAAGTVEVHLIHGAGLGRPEDLSAVPPMPTYTSVHGRRAITAPWGGTGGQILWIERQGLGVFVGVDAPLRGELNRIADGVRDPF